MTKTSHRDTVRSTSLTTLPILMVICKASNLSYALLSLNFSSKTSPEHLPYLQPYPSQCRVFSSSTDNSRWSSKDEHLANGINHHCDDRRYRGANDDGGGGGERKVNCDVEVISWRERRVKAQILVNADIESLWNALTDYERLADFIPEREIYRPVWAVVEAGQNEDRACSGRANLGLSKGGSTRSRPRTMFGPSYLGLSMSSVDFARLRIRSRVWAELIWLR
ncbi:hypothetical protein CsSME_00002890 [Camellia sinensis var. sinensis]